ncbi:hypothetical protein ACOJBO_02930 [Rhizobium beringeri]
MVAVSSKGTAAADGVLLVAGPELVFAFVVDISMFPFGGLSCSALFSLYLY